MARFWMREVKGSSRLWEMCCLEESISLAGLCDVNVKRTQLQCFGPG